MSHQKAGRSRQGSDPSVRYSFNGLSSSSVWQVEPSWRGPGTASTCGGPRLAGGTAIQSRLQVSISCRNCRGCQSKALTPGLHCTRGGCRTARERRIYLQKSLQGAMFPMKTVPLASVPSTCHTDVIPRDAQPSWFQRDRSHMLRTAHRRTKGTWLPDDAESHHSGPGLPVYPWASCRVSRRLWLVTCSQTQSWLWYEINLAFPP